MIERPVDSVAPLRWYHRLFVASLYLLPHHLLSALMFRLTRLGWPPLKDLMIERFIRLYAVDMDEALQSDPRIYPTFNDFFTRALDPAARPLAPEAGAIVCPADGHLSQAGRIEAGRIFQAKGRDFSLEELLGGDAQWMARFEGGSFATVYLSPRDYHRVHMPFSGTLRRMLHVPGRLFSVSPITTRVVPRLFARNERVICLFETAVGPMAIILVGAIFVASIDTAWAGRVTPTSQRVAVWDYGSDAARLLSLEKGAEMGRFNMGSTVILLFGPEAVDWAGELQPGASVRMGQRIGSGSRLSDGALGAVQ
jgi:phosphatidylserine decarboxylase